MSQREEKGVNAAVGWLRQQGKQPPDAANGVISGCKSQRELRLSVNKRVKESRHFFPFFLFLRPLHSVIFLD